MPAVMPSGMGSQYGNVTSGHCCQDSNLVPAPLWPCNELHSCSLWASLSPWLCDTLYMCQHGKQTLTQQGEVTVTYPFFSTNLYPIVVECTSSYSHHYSRLCCYESRLKVIIFKYETPSFCLCVLMYKATSFFF